MSNVTNVILKHGIVSEETGSLTSRINEFFRQSRFSDVEYGFINLDEVQTHRKPYGGTKCLECEVLVGAFNHLDIRGLVEHLLTIPWEEPEETQLFVQYQEADRLEEVLWFDNRLGKLVIFEPHMP